MNFNDGNGSVCDAIIMTKVDFWVLTVSSGLVLLEETLSHKKYWN